MDWKQVLEIEHECQRKGFIFQLRCRAQWDQVQYERLFNAMKECCKYYAGHSDIPRWIAELFWMLDWWIKQEAENLFKKDINYDWFMNNAVVNFNHLAVSLFTGEIRDDSEFESIHQ